MTVLTEILAATAGASWLFLGGWGWGMTCLAFINQRWRLQTDAGLQLAAELHFLATALGLGILSTATLLIGWGFGLSRLLPYVLPGVGLVLAGVTYRYWPAWQRSQQSKVISQNSNWSLQWPLVIAAVLGALYTLLNHALMPPVEWDELAYHLALPARYIRAGGVIYYSDIVHSNWPLQTEMLFTLGLLLNNELIHHVITWGFGLGAAWGVFLLGRRLVSLRMGQVAAASLLTIPLVLRLGGTGLIDIVLAFYGAALLLTYYFYRQGKNIAWLIIAGALAGIGASTKLTGGAFPLLFGLLIVFWEIKSDLKEKKAGYNSWPVWRRWRFVRRGLAFGLIGLCFVGPWYLRSYVATGNPVYPFLFAIFGGGPNWDEVGDAYHTQQMMENWSEALPMSPAGFLKTIYLQFADPTKLGGFDGGIGWLVLSMALVGSLVAIWRRHPFMLEIILFAGAYYLIWFTILSRQIRFLYPIFPALALLGGYGFVSLWDQLSGLSVRYRVAGRWMLAIALLGGLGFSLPWHRNDARQQTIAQLPALVNDSARATYLSNHVRVAEASQFINQNLPESAKVLLLPYENRGYYLERDYFWGHPLSQRVIKFEQYNSASELAADLAAMGFTHVLDNPEWIYEEIPTWAQSRALMLALVSDCGHLEAAWADVKLFSLVQCSQMQSPTP